MAATPAAALVRATPVTVSPIRMKAHALFAVDAAIRAVVAFSRFVRRIVVFKTMSAAPTAAIVRATAAAMSSIRMKAHALFVVDAAIRAVVAFMRFVRRIVVFKAMAATPAAALVRATPVTVSPIRMKAHALFAVDAAIRAVVAFSRFVRRIAVFKALSATPAAALVRATPVTVSSIRMKAHALFAVDAAIWAVAAFLCFVRRIAIVVNALSAAPAAALVRAMPVAVSSIRMKAHARFAVDAAIRAIVAFSRFIRRIAIVVNALFLAVSAVASIRMHCMPLAVPPAMAALRSFHSFRQGYFQQFSFAMLFLQIGAPFAAVQCIYGTAPWASVAICDIFHKTPSFQRIISFAWYLCILAHPSEIVKVPFYFFTDKHLQNKRRPSHFPENISKKRDGRRDTATVKNGLYSLSAPSSARRRRMVLSDWESSPSTAESTL